MIVVKLLLVCAAILAINIPFGYWRAGVGKWSWRWFLSVHLPIPLIILIRLWLGVGWHLSSLPLFVAAFFVGQLTGGKLRG